MRWSKWVFLSSSVLSSLSLFATNSVLVSLDFKAVTREYKSFNKCQSVLVQMQVYAPCFSVWLSQAVFLFFNYSDNSPFSHNSLHEPNGNSFLSPIISWNLCDPFSSLSSIFLWSVNWKKCFFQTFSELGLHTTVIIFVSGSGSLARYSTSTKSITTLQSIGETSYHLKLVNTFRVKN